MRPSKPLEKHLELRTLEDKLEIAREPGFDDEEGTRRETENVRGEISGS